MLGKLDSNNVKDTDNVVSEKGQPRFAWVLLSVQILFFNDFSQFMEKGFYLESRLNTDKSHSYFPKDSVASNLVKPGSGSLELFSGEESQIPFKEGLKFH